MSCLLITLNKCLKGHKSLGLLFVCQLVKSWQLVSQWVTRSPIELFWTAKNKRAWFETRPETISTSITTIPVTDWLPVYWGKSSYFIILQFFCTNPPVHKHWGQILLELRSRWILSFLVPRVCCTLERFMMVIKKSKSPQNRLHHCTSWPFSLNCQMAGKIRHCLPSQ